MPAQRMSVGVLMTRPRRLGKQVPRCRISESAPSATGGPPNRPCPGFGDPGTLPAGAGRGPSLPLFPKTLVVQAGRLHYEEGCFPMRLFVSAGEPSGDLHGANLLRALQDLQPAVECHGFGGEHLERAGCRLVFPLCDFAVVGFVKVLASVPRFA